MLHETLMETSVAEILFTPLRVEAQIVFRLKDAATLIRCSFFEETYVCAARSHILLQLVHQQAAIMLDH